VLGEKNDAKVGIAHSDDETKMLHSTVYLKNVRECLRLSGQKENKGKKNRKIACSVIHSLVVVPSRRTKGGKDGTKEHAINLRECPCLGWVCSVMRSEKHIAVDGHLS
jgi:hypothetical protein